jgi:hypothetical protein
VPEQVLVRELELVQVLEPVLGLALERVRERAPEPVLVLEQVLVWHRHQQ